MSLSKSDKEWLLEEIKKAVTETLTVEWTVEKKRDKKTGQPLAKPEKKTEKVFLPAVFVQLLPFYEGAMRGMQADVDRSINRTNKMHDKVDIIGQMVVSNANVIKSLVTSIQEQLTYTEMKKIDYIEGEVKEDVEE
jgi:hypothetical protein